MPERVTLAPCEGLVAKLLLPSSKESVFVLYDVNSAPKAISAFVTASGFRSFYECQYSFKFYPIVL